MVMGLRRLRYAIIGVITSFVYEVIASRSANLIVEHFCQENLLTRIPYLIIIGVANLIVFFLSAILLRVLFIRVVERLDENTVNI